MPVRTDRTKLIEGLRIHFENRRWPRVVLFVIVALSGFAGFIVSFALLSAGMSSMGWRYGLAGIAAYVTFLCLLAVYVLWHRSGGAIDSPDALDVLNVADLRVPGDFSYGVESAPAFTGGQSGGGGASSSWGSTSSSSSEAGSWFDADFDAGFVLIALAALAVGLLAVGYVIWVAPVLLAEVFVDAIIVGTVSKHLGLLERRDWTATVLRRTWIPATLMILTLTVGGWALQQAVPDARSIGPAVQSLFS